MKCVKCGGKTQVLDTRHNTDTNEILRRRECKSCHKQFYTTEFVIESTPSFMDEWSTFHRDLRRKKK